MKRILILEDELLVATQWQEVLEGAGHEVIHVTQSDEAIAVLDEGGVDVLVCDMLIRGSDGQVGKSGGLTVFTHVRLHVQPRPRLIAVSGAHPSLNVLKNAKLLSADVALVKPILASELVEAVESLINSDEDG